MEEKENSKMLMFSISNSWLKAGVHFSKMQKSEGEAIRRRKLMTLLWIFGVGEAF